jgi:hypothetical protein
VRQRYRSRQGGLGRSEGSAGGRRPLQCLGGPSECVCERLECAGDTWKETSVKIHHNRYLKTVVIVSHPEGEEIH